MKQYLLVILLLFSVKNEAQTEFQSLLKNATKVNLPYTSISPSINLENSKKILHATDSIFLVTKLNRITPKTINRYGDSPFGQIDCIETANNIELETNNCLKIDEMKEIAILCYVKNYDQYLLHVELTQKGGWGDLKGILVSMNPNGDVLDWFFSNGSANGGNPHGNVSRDFTIQKNFTIDIEESSWGDNNISYSFKAKCEVSFDQDQSKDYIYGGFKLKNLSIKY